MAELHQTEVCVIGAGPAGLFAVFQLGLVDLRCHVIEALGRSGGQLTALYPDKPIYDMPGFRVIDGQPLADRLMDQISPFDTHFHFGRRATGIARAEPQEGLPLGGWCIGMDDGGAVLAKATVIATGGGVLGQGRIHTEPLGDGVFLDSEGGLIPADTRAFETATPGLFAIGDGCVYPGKLKLIVSAFHEAALMAQAAFAICHPQKRLKFQYTTSSSELQRRLGVRGAD